jgi:hypothetical protein
MGAHGAPDSDVRRDRRVERDRLLRTAVQALAQPVLDGLGHGVAAGGRPDADLEVAVELPELVLDVLLGPAGHLAAYPVAVGAVAKRHRAAPPPGAPFVKPRIAAVAGVVKVDGIIAETAPTHALRVSILAPGMAPGDTSCTQIRPLTCGAKGARTPDPLLAKQVLFQLSYSPRMSPA